MGLFSVTTRSDGIVLTADIWNTDHDTIVAHTEPFSMNSYEATVPQMQIEENPVPGGVVSLPSAMSNELARLRYTDSLLKALISSGTFPPHWYTLVSAYSAVVGLPIVAARREMTAATPCPSGITVNLTSAFDFQVYDTASFGLGMIAPVAGVYSVGITLGFGDGDGTGPSGDFLLTLTRVTGATRVNIASNRDDTGATASSKIACVETTAHFNAGQALSATVLQSGGSTKAILSQANARPALWMALIGR